MLSLFSFAAFLISLDFENATCRFSGSASCSQNRMFKNHTSWDPSAHLLVNIFETFLPELREISIFPLHMAKCFLTYRFTDRKLNLAASSETVWSFVSEKKKALSQKDGLSTPPPRKSTSMLYAAQQICNGSLWVLCFSGSGGGVFEAARTLLMSQFFCLNSHRVFSIIKLSIKDQDIGGIRY